HDKAVVACATRKRQGCEPEEWVELREDVVLGGISGDGLVLLGPLAPGLGALAGLAGGAGLFAGDLLEEVGTLAGGAVHGGGLLSMARRFSTPLALLRRVRARRGGRLVAAEELSSSGPRRPYLWMP